MTFVTSSSSEQQIRFHVAFTFDWNATAFLEAVFVFYAFVDGAAHLDAADHSVGFHATGDIHGIAPQVVAELCPANDTGDDWANVDSDPGREVRAPFRIKMRELPLNAQGHFCGGLGMVIAPRSMRSRRRTLAS